MVMDGGFKIHGVDPTRGSASILVMARVKKMIQRKREDRAAPAPAPAPAPASRKRPHPDDVLEREPLERHQGGKGGNQAWRENEGVEGRIKAFAEINGLDDRCLDAFLRADPRAAEWVMDADFRLSVNPARGTASGLAMAQLKKAKQQDLANYPSDRDIDRRLEHFIRENALDKQAQDRLYALTSEEQVK